MTIQNYKKKYLICKDDFYKNIYAGDTVELYCPTEISTTWNSIVYWNMLDGAFIHSHQVGKLLYGENSMTKLSSMINQQELNICDVGSDIPIKYKGYCKKIKSFYQE